MEVLNNNQKQIKTEVRESTKVYIPQLENQLRRLEDLVNSDEFLEAYNLLCEISPGFQHLAKALNFLSDCEIKEGTSQN